MDIKKRKFIYITPTVLFEMAFLFMYVSGFIGSTSFKYLAFFSNGRIQDVLNLFGIAVLILKFVMEFSITIRRMIISLLMIGVGVGIFIKTHSIEPLLVILLGVSTDSVELKGFLRFSMLTAVISIIFMIFMSKVGVIYNFTYLRDGHLRQALGDTYPTGLSSRVTFIFMMWWLLTKFKVNIKKSVLTIFVALVVNNLTNSRVDFVILLTLGLTPFLVNGFRLKKWKKWMLSLAGIFPVLMYIAMNVFVHFYRLGMPAAYKLDGLVSNRIMYSSQGLNDFSSKTLFGQIVPMVGSGGLNGYVNSNTNFLKYFFIDNAYIYVLLVYGILFLVAIFAVYFFANLRLVLNGEYAFPVLLVLLSLHWFVNQYIVSYYYSPFFILGMAFVLGKPDQIREFVER